MVYTRQLAIQEADELHAAVVDEASADERLAEDRVAPEGGGLGPVLTANWRTAWSVLKQPLCLNTSKACSPLLPEVR